MLRNMAIAAIVGMATLIGTSAARAQTLSWGVWRENAPSVPEDQRNCWSQAMVSGGTINGELIGERSTQQQAENLLRSDAQRGLCASRRVSTSWAAMGNDASNSNSSNPDWSNGNRSNRGQ